MTTVPPSFPPKPDHTTQPTEYLEWMIRRERIYGDTKFAHAIALNLNAIRMNHIILTRYATDVAEEAEQMELGL